MNNRKLMFSLAAIAIAGFGLVGCGSDDNGGNGNNNNDKKPTEIDCNGVKCVDGYCADGVCSMTCEDAGGCDDSARCSDTAVCHSDKSCKDVGTCKYTCGEGNTCQWAVCSGSSKCQSSTTCAPATLPTGINDDFDNDGIPNSVELQSKILDPCLADTDGDTIPDNEEDLNKNGIYEPELGETNPADPTDKPSTEEAALVRAVCASDAQNSLDVTKLDDFSVAMPNGIGGSKMTGDVLANADGKNSVARFNDDKGIAFFFASSGSESFTAKGLFRYVAQNAAEGALPFTDYVEASNFSSEIPLSSWFDTGYKSELQTIPNHDVTRYIYRLTIPSGKTINDVRDALADLFVGNAASKKPLGTATACQADESGNSSATLYLARSTYKEDSTVVVYSVAVACSDDVNTQSINARMTDVLSGTHVAPNGLSSSVLGYNAKSRIKCQKTDFGDSSSKVDFIWVVDNSGSMADELNNLAETASAFMNKLERSKIDYRIGVATTDSYILDEWVYGSAYPMATNGSIPQAAWQINPFSDEKNKEYADELVNQTSYFGYTGLRWPVGGSSQAMMSSTEARKTLMGNLCAQSAFACTVKSSGSQSACTAKDSLNLCGLGREDGLKSGAMVLERLSLNVAEPYENFLDSDELSDEERAIRKAKRQKSNSIFKRGTSANNTCKTADDLNDPKNKQCMTRIEASSLRDDALHYIIWVSDEESRQFKEPVDGDKLIVNDASLIGCLTGYKLSGGDVEDGDTFDFANPDLQKLVYSMRTGAISLTADTDEVCNPTLKDVYKQKEDGTYTLTEDMTLDQIRAVSPEFYNMLMYYIQQYHKYAGSVGVAGFALVGDAGKANGGFCDQLGNTVSSTEGANYGLSYILMAKYLSKLTSDGKNDGKGGGYASICSTNYSDTVDSIFQDVLGRLSKHGLQGYPVASTIRVAIVKQGSDVAEELTRGKDWSYDASQNTITFSYSKGESSDKIAISYVLWEKITG